MAKTSTLLACAALALALAVPRAADAGPKQDARVHLDRATKAHKAGDLELALTELNAAYAIEPQPQILYALGQIYTKLGRCTEASDAYLRFLSTSTSTDTRTAQVVKQAIDACKSAEPAAGKAEPAPPSAVDDELPPNVAPSPASAAPAPKQVALTRAPEPTPAPSAGKASPWYRDLLGGVLVAGGAASIVLGSLAYRAAITDLDTAERASSHEKYTDLVDGARTKRLVGVAFVTGGAVLITAGVLRFALRDRHTEVRRVGLAPARGGGLLTWTRSF
jgi:tetratricopeptide (TPR) repeat protein